MSVCQPTRNAETPKPMRADPMSFSSILSSTIVDPPKSIVKLEPVLKHSRKSPKTPNGDAAPISLVQPTATSTPTMPTTRKSPHKTQTPLHDENYSRDRTKESSKHKTPKSFPSTKVVPTTSDKENENVEQVLAEINAMDLSDIEAPGWMDERERYKQSSQKRQISVEEVETSKRKVRYTHESILASSVAFMHYVSFSSNM